LEKERMEIGKTLYVVDRKAWRQWLSKNHKIEKENILFVFLSFPHKIKRPNTSNTESITSG